MVLYFWRLWKCLEFRQKVAIVLVIIAPPIAFRFIEFLWLNLWAEALVYLGWAVLAALMTAYMVATDSRESKDAVDQRIEPLSDELERQKEYSTRRLASLRDQIRQVDQAMRAAFEELGVKLPPRRLGFSAEVTHGAASGSVSVQGRHQKWYLHIWKWILHFARRLRQLVWG